MPTLASVNSPFPPTIAQAAAAPPPRLVFNRRGTQLRAPDHQGPAQGNQLALAAAAASAPTGYGASSYGTGLFGA